jgi:hypothetical protein
VTIALVLGTFVVGAPGPAGAAPSWEATDLPAVDPGPPGAFETSPAVSCVSAGSCIAVGSYAPIGVHSLSLGGGVAPMVDELSGGTWSAVPLPMPAGGSDASLSAVSCLSGPWCVAVGQYSPPGGGARPLVETLSAGAWTVRALALPRRAYFTSLSPVPLMGGVSCVSVTSCVAVGVYPVHSGRTLGCCYRYFPLMETLKGSSWTPSTAPTPRGGSDGSLSTVSCSGAAACVAVGSVTTASGSAPMAETLTGARWRATTLSLPPGGSYPTPFPWSVSCVDSGCVALGAYLPGGSSGALVAETLSAGSWSSDALPVPSGASYGFPFIYEPQSGVSCVSALSCVVVSTDQASGGGQGGLVDTLNAGVWTSTSLPVPPGGSSVFPQAVSCSGTGSCVAVGSYPPSGGGESSLVETESGATWTASTLPLPAATPYASLTAMSCVSAITCVAVGNAYGADHVQVPFQETLAGAIWTSSSMPLPPHTVPSGDANPLIQGLSCTSASSCVAVGYDPGPALAEHPLIEVLTGTRWKPELVPLPTGFRRQAASLSAVTCVSSTSCVAVGALRSEDDALIETLEGSTWVATVLSPPLHEPRIWLSSVACQAVTSCEAVGAFWGSNPGFSRPLVATLSGTVWRVKTLALPSDARNDIAFTIPMLQSVSCVSTTSCTAVGFYPTSFDNASPLVETMSGSRWQAAVPPTTAGANWTLLWGVSCRSDTSCVAVGEDDGLPLTEISSGGTWQLSAVPLPAGDSGASLQDVNCASATSCLAVGGSTSIAGVYPSVGSEGNQ